MMRRRYFEYFYMIEEILARLYWLGHSGGRREKEMGVKGRGRGHALSGLKWEKGGLKGQKGSVGWWSLEGREILCEQTLDSTVIALLQAWTKSFIKIDLSDQAAAITPTDRQMMVTCPSNIIVIHSMLYSRLKSKHIPIQPHKHY